MNKNCNTIALNSKQQHAMKDFLCNPSITRILFDGGSRSGKTVAISLFLFLRACQFPGSRQLVARKYRSDAKQSLWNDTLVKMRKLFPSSLCSLDKSNLTMNFFNGSSICIGGLDDAERAEKILGNEYITVFLNEATQISYFTMQMAVTRLAQKVNDSDGNFAVPKLIMDCNPRGPRHWLHYVGVRHVDPETELPLNDSDHWGRLNWSAYDNKENLPAEYLAQLEALPGIMRDRMLNGIWRDNEGAVYSEFDEDLHVVEPFTIPPDWRRIRAIDFGYTNPFVCLWGAVDEDGRLYIYKELYQRNLLISDAASRILDMSRGEHYFITAADHDAQGRAELNSAGVITAPAKKDVLSGIQEVKNRLSKRKDNSSGIYFFRSLKNILSEIQAYEWLPPAEGRNAKEEPKKENDHAMDALRYMVMELSSHNASSIRSLLLSKIRRS